MTDQPPLKPYQPSNGTEGDMFTAYWCHHCERDRAFRESGYDGDPALGCQIFAASMAYRIDDPNYPKEWVYGRDGAPKCTAYTEDPTLPLRCQHTPDMFQQKESR